jgi:hypothetical protein
MYDYTRAVQFTAAILLVAVIHVSMYFRSLAWTRRPHPFFLTLTWVQDAPVFCAAVPRRVRSSAHCRLQVMHWWGVSARVVQNGHGRTWRCLRICCGCSVTLCHHFTCHDCRVVLSLGAPQAFGPALALAGRVAHACEDRDAAGCASSVFGTD